MRLRKHIATAGLVIGGALASNPVLAASVHTGSPASIGALPFAGVPRGDLRSLVVPPPQRCVRETRPVTDDGRAGSRGVDWKRFSPAAPQFSADLSQRWGKTVLELFYFNAIGHTVRMFQQRTRVELKGPFLKEWLQSAKPIFADPHWDDEGSFSINYIGHAMSGASYGMIQRQNNGRAWNASFGSSEYWGNMPLSMFVSFVASLQFEIGPISEASLGNVGMNPVKQGYVDIVVTPALGMAWMIGQDAFDKYVMTKIESKITSEPWRATIRIISDLPRTMANLVAGKAPWYRQDRPLGGRR
jgi:hypothetical protein